MNKYLVEIEFKFIRTNEESEEKSPSEEELEMYMKRGYLDREPTEENYPRYILYLQSLYEYGDYGFIPENIKYSQNKLTYLLTELTSEFIIKGSKLIPTNGLFKTIEEVRNDLEMNRDCLSDGIWEGMPGSEGIYPVKNSWNEETKTYEDELGVISYEILKIELI